MTHSTDTDWLDALIKQAQAEPGLADLAELSRLMNEADQVTKFLHESSVVYMVSSGTTTARAFEACPPGET